MSSLLDVRPITFIRKGTRLDVKFKVFEDDETDHYDWFTGEVVKVKHITIDKVVCNVLYDDGEYVEDATFLNQDYYIDDDDEQDAWRFNGNINTVITFLIEYSKTSREQFNTSSESDNDSNSSHTEDEEDEEDEEEESDNFEDEPKRVSRLGRLMSFIGYTLYGVAISTIVFNVLHNSTTNPKLQSS